MPGFLSPTSDRVIRCEIVLPKKYNDGSDVEPQAYKITWDELVDRFGGVTANEATGGWSRFGKVYEEENHVYKVDFCINVARSQLKFLEKEYKQILKARFRQLDIYIISYPVKRH